MGPRVARSDIHAASELKYPTGRGHTAFAFVIEGQEEFGVERMPRSGTAQRVFVPMVIASGQRRRGEVVMSLLISDEPVGCPVAWCGPIAVNTRRKLRLAVEKSQNRPFTNPEGS